MTYPPPAIQVLLVLLVVLAAIFDLRTRRIPNWLTVAGVLSGLSLNYFLFDTTGLLLSLKGLGLALLLYFPLFLIRAMGAGDAKLMLAVGSIVGPWNWLGICFLALVLGAPIALVLVVFRRRVQSTFGNMRQIIGSLVSLRAPYHVNPALDAASPKALTMPHGAIIALAAVVFLALGAAQNAA